MLNAFDCTNIANYYENEKVEKVKHINENAPNVNS